MVRSYPLRYRRHVPARRAFAAQGDDLALKAGVDLAFALGTRAAANYICTRPNPDYVWCNVSNDVAKQQEEKAANSLAVFGLWGGVGLAAALIAAIVEN